MNAKKSQRQQEINGKQDVITNAKNIERTVAHATSVERIVPVCICKMKRVRATIGAVAVMLSSSLNTNELRLYIKWLFLYSFF